MQPADQRRRELLTLIDFFDHCQYPLLIHCKAGADRTGLASALYLMIRQDEPPREAIRAFTIYHGHVPLFGTEHLHEPLDEYAQWLDSRGLTHTPARFREWVKKRLPVGRRMHRALSSRPRAAETTVGQNL